MKVWHRIQDDLISGPDVRLGKPIKDLKKMFRDVDAEILNKMEMEYKPDPMDRIQFEMVDHFSFITRRLAGVTGETRWHSAQAKDLQCLNDPRVEWAQLDSTSKDCEAHFNTNKKQFDG